MKPDIFLFNPTCEIAIANGTVSYMPNRLLRQFEKELGALPLFFANSKDVILVREFIDAQFIDLLSNCGVSMPQFKILEGALEDQSFLATPKGLLQPWGWSPATHHLLAPLKGACSNLFHSLPNANWANSHKDIYSRATALGILKSIKKRDHQNHYISSNLLPRICNSIGDIEKAIDYWGPIVVKAPWSSSGRGLQVLRNKQLNRPVIQWIEGTLKSQNYVMVEPWLNKVHDFSLHYRITPEKDIEFLGPAYFFTNSNGQYQGSYLRGLTSGHQITDSFLTQERLNRLSQEVKEAIYGSPIFTNFSGYLGVDCLIFSDSQNNLTIHPCLEINLRYTMGTLSLFLEKYIHPMAEGKFQIFFEPGKSFSDFHKKMTNLYPFKKEQGLWRRGYIPLVSPFTPKNFGAYIVLE